MAKERDFLRGGSYSHLIGLGSGESDALLKLTAPGDRAAGHHRDEAGARAAVDTIVKGGVLRDKKFCRNRSDKGEAIFLGAIDITKNSFGLFPMTRSRRGHKPARHARML